MFDKIFVSPQMKRIVIISNKHGIYELPHQLHSVLPLPGIRGGDDSCVINQAGGATAKPQGPGFVSSARQGVGNCQTSRARVGTHSGGEDDFTLNFTNFVCGAILNFSKFFI